MMNSSASQTLLDDEYHEAGNDMRGVANNTTNITTTQMMIERIAVLTPSWPAH
jgi:hypothetical protein